MEPFSKDQVPLAERVSQALLVSEQMRAEPKAHKSQDFILFGVGPEAARIAIPQYMREHNYMSFVALRCALTLGKADWVVCVREPTSGWMPPDNRAGAGVVVFAADRHGNQQAAYSTLSEDQLRLGAPEIFDGSQLDERVTRLLDPVPSHMLPMARDLAQKVAGVTALIRDMQPAPAPQEDEPDLVLSAVA